ncbi:hypothetical protein [Nocardia sp. NPDC057455]|uniref:hypothetical protein n=1 Tax=Nocardia sp. NPDC057455 TaxID=3346138 RepID=UPI00366A5E47
MIRRDPGQPDREILIQITDVDLSAAEPEALRISRFYERHVDHAPTTPAHVRITDGVLNFEIHDEGWRLRDHTAGTLFAMPEHLVAPVIALWTADAHVVGVVPSFDTFTLDGILARAGHPGLEPWHYRLNDVENHAAGYLRGLLRAGLAGQLPSDITTPVPEFAEDWTTVLELSRRSEQTSRACGVEPPGPVQRHTAMGDARWARDWWDVIHPEWNPRTHLTIDRREPLVVAYAVRWSSSSGEEITHEVDDRATGGAVVAALRAAQHGEKRIPDARLVARSNSPDGEVGEVGEWTMPAIEAGNV